MNWERIKCFLKGGHSWTCDSEQDIPPPDEPPSIAVFFRYARMWCKRCRRYCDPKPHLQGSEHWDASLKYRPEVSDG